MNYLKFNDYFTRGFQQIEKRAMPKRKDPPLDPKEQFKRFQEAAKEHGVDDHGVDAERAFAKIAAASRQQGKRSKSRA